MTAPLDLHAAHAAATDLAWSGIPFHPYSSPDIACSLTPHILSIQQCAHPYVISVLDAHAPRPRLAHWRCNCQSGMHKRARKTDTPGHSSIRHRGQGSRPCCSTQPWHKVWHRACPERDTARRPTPTTCQLSLCLTRKHTCTLWKLLVAWITTIVGPMQRAHTRKPSRHTLAVTPELPKHGPPLLLLTRPAAGTVHLPTPLVTLLLLLR